MGFKDELSNIMVLEYINSVFIIVFGKYILVIIMMIKGR